MSARRYFALMVAPAEHLLLQIPRALIVSVLALAVDIAVLSLLVVAGAAAELAFGLGYLAGGVVQYVLCSTWVFPNAPRSAATGFVVFTILSLGGLGLTELTVRLLHTTWGFDLAVTKFVAVGLAFNWNFFTRKYFLFQSEGTAVAAPE